MALQIYNTMSGKKEAFAPLEPGVVKMYVCGPTVYNFLHVGNFRGPIVFNLVRNWLERAGYKVNFVYNYTDVDDRIIERAKKDGVPASEISERYIREFETDFASLGLRKHDANPRVTEHMAPIVAIASELVEKDKAYVKGGEVLYSVRKFPEYGKLSGKNIDDLQMGARIEVDSKKNDPLDFALWKPAKTGEPSWPSPWGEGRPGWHIECSAMIKSLLGEQIDIHGGGLDLIFPHHENEIAQSEGASGKPLARFWMHNNMINFGSQKMSKSLGNIKTVREFLSQYDGEILKFLILSSHYRSVSEFSEKQIMGAIAGLARIYSSLALAQSLAADDGAAPAADQGGKQAPSPIDAGFKMVLETQGQAVAAALDDDFNTAEVFAAIYVAIRGFNSLYKRGQKRTPEGVATARAFIAWVQDFGSLMSLFQDAPESYLRVLDDMLLEKKQLARKDIDALVAERSEARAAKNWAKSDELRDLLNQKGIALQDGVAGTHWEVQKT